MINSTLRTRASVPIKVGGLEIPNSTTTCSQNYQTPMFQHRHLLQALKGRVQFDNFRHKECMIKLRTGDKKIKIANAKKLLFDLSCYLPATEKRNVKYLQEKGT